MVNVHWVEAHKQRFNTREQRLNDLVDKIANLQHLAKGAWKSKVVAQILPSQMIQVWLHQNVYDRCYDFFRAQARTAFPAVSPLWLRDRQACLP